MAATATPQRIDAPPHPRRGGPRDESGSAIAFFVATGILCLHVLDDNFLQPQPGTAAADHLLSGLVPIALLLGIATIYPRLRAGARGSLGADDRPVRRRDGRERGRLLHTRRRPFGR